MKKSFVAIMWAVAIILFVGAVVDFLFVKKLQSINQPRVVAQGEGLTYTIKEFGFSFSYPEEYNGKKIKVTPKPNVSGVYIMYENKGPDNSMFQILAKAERVDASTEIGTSYGSSQFRYDPSTNTWRNLDDQFSGTQYELAPSGLIQKDEESYQLTWENLFDQLSSTRSSYPVLTTNSGVKAFPHDFATYGSVYQAYRLFSPDHTTMANFYLYLQNVFDDKKNDDLYQEFINARDVLMNISRTARFKN